MTQESPFELLLTVSRMQHRVPRRTASRQGLFLVGASVRRYWDTVT